MVARDPRRREALKRGVSKKRARNSRRADHWTSRLIPAANGGYVGSEYNVLQALRYAPEVQGLVRFNEFALEVEFTSEAPWRVTRAGDRWTEADDTLAAAWLQSEGIKVRGRSIVADCIQVVACDRPYHPVREYLLSLKWDGKWRLATWLHQYLGANGSLEYLSAIGRKFLMSAVARILHPGCQADHILVLEGLQGLGKTSVARALAVQPEWFAGSLPDVHSKDAPLQLAGRWIIEIAELKAVRVGQLEAVKSFLSETIDTFRPPYARRSAQFPRQCVFLGTTNETEYLRDRTGNRRFWPVRVARIDLTAILRERHQLWAEAVQCVKDGEQWHLTQAEAEMAKTEQAERVPQSELDLAVADYLSRETGNEVTVRDVLIYGLALDPDDESFVDRARRLGSEVAEAIVRCGWVKAGRAGQLKRTVYRRVGKGGHGK
jgi:predicted P-loop ATPase